MNKRGYGLMILLVLAAMLRLPSPGVDVAKLQPVEAVLIRNCPEGLEIRTDTDAFGTGATLNDAVKDLHRHATGTVFLDTADDLLMETDQISCETLMEIFRPGCKVCRSSKITDLQEAVAFLHTHPLKTTLLRACSEGIQEYLVQGAGGLERNESENSSSLGTGSVHGSDSAQIWLWMDCNGACGGCPDSAGIQGGSRDWE